MFDEYNNPSDETDLYATLGKVAATMVVTYLFLAAIIGLFAWWMMRS